VGPPVGVRGAASSSCMADGGGVAPDGFCIDCFFFCIKVFWTAKPVLVMSLMGEKDGRLLPHGRVGATTRLPARRAATGSAPARAPRVVAGHSPIGPANGCAGSIQWEAMEGISAQPIMRPSPPHFVGRPKTESTTFRRAAQESRRLRRVARLPPHPEPAARAAGRPRRCAGGPLPAPRHADGAQGGGC